MSLCLTIDFITRKCNFISYNCEEKSIFYFILIFIPWKKQTCIQFIPFHAYILWLWCKDKQTRINTLNPHLHQLCCDCVCLLAGKKKKKSEKSRQLIRLTFNWTEAKAKRDMRPCLLPYLSSQKQQRVAAMVTFIISTIFTKAIRQIK